MARTKARRAVLLAVAAAVLAAVTPGEAVAETPSPGDIQRLTVISLSLRVGSTEKESKRATYTPPPGWYVRSHQVICACRSGNCSYAISTVPANWAWSSQDQTGESHRRLGELTARAHDAGFETRFRREQEAALSQAGQTISSHHALVLDACARGEGLFKGGAALELTVTAELVYVGADEVLPRDLPQQAVMLK